MPSEKKYILALDQGTTSSRAILFNSKAKKIASVQQEFTQYFPKPGWVEHDANELFLCQLTVAQDAIKKAKIIGIGGGTVAAGLRNKGYYAVVWSTMDETCHPVTIH